MTSEIGRLSRELEAARQDGAFATDDPATAILERRLAALAGQLRAVAVLAPAAAHSGGLRSRRPHRAIDRPLRQLRQDLWQLRADLNWESPIGRHAVRVAVVVPAAELIARQLPLSRGYWMVVAAAAVLRPEYGATFTRGAERALGTVLGAGLAGLIAADAASDRRRDGRARRAAGVAGVLDLPRQLHRRVRFHHRTGRVPAQHRQPGHAGDGRGADPRHADRRRAGAARLRGVADVVRSARARRGGRAARRPAPIPVRRARRLHHRDTAADRGDPPDLSEAAAGPGQRRVDRRAVAV